MVFTGRTHRKEVLNILLEKAGVQGYLTTDDLIEVVPDFDSERMSVIMTVLRRKGVDILDPDGEYLWWNRPPLKWGMNPGPTRWNQF